MKKQAVNAHAKINLTLDVTAKREDGYHLVSMVMQSIGLCDTVTVSAHTGTNDIVIDTNKPELPNDKSNLCFKAADKFFENTEAENDGIEIFVEKNIPMAAGLAGGSTDAAAVLVLLNRLYETNLTEKELCEIGLKIGADVPFCIMGGTMLAEGIGEKLTRLPDAPNTIIVLCKPPFDVPTPVIYKAIDKSPIKKHPDNNAMCRAIEIGSVKQIAGLLENVMQPVTAGIHPEITDIRSLMIDGGALGAIMSGSGPSVFGIFDDMKKAKRVCAELKKNYSETYITDFSSSSMTDFM